MPHRIRLLPWFLLINLSAWAQAPSDCTTRVEGSVYDLATREPLPFVNVQVKNVIQKSAPNVTTPEATAQSDTAGNMLGATTPGVATPGVTVRGAVADENGHYIITGLCGNEFDLVFSYVGYKSVIHHHDDYHDFPQTFLAPEDITLESIVVEAEAPAGDFYSGTVEKLSERAIESHASESLADLASELSGVTVIKTGQNVVKPVIHGLHSNRILIINNGIRHEYQSWGDDHAPEIDPSLANSISVIKGAATVRYGPDALGGVLLINPPPMELSTAWRGEAGLTGQSNGRAGEVNLRLQKGFKRLALLAEGSVLRQGDRHAPNYNLSNTGRQENSLALGAKYHWSGLDMDVYYSHFYQELGILRGSVTSNLDNLQRALAQEPPQYTEPFTYEIKNPRQQVSHDLLKVKGTLNQVNQTLEIQYGLQANHRQEFDIRRGDNNQRPSIDLELYTHTLDVNWQHPEVAWWNGSVGIQGFYQNNSNQPGTSTIPFVPNYQNYRLGVYLIESREFSDNLLEWGIRYDYQLMSVIGRRSTNEIYATDLRYQNLTATVGLVRDLSRGHTFRTNLGMAWRPPSVSELYSNGKHGFTAEYGRYTPSGNLSGSANPEQDDPVVSEKGFKWINTLEINRKAFQAELTAYVNYIPDYIYSKPGGLTQTVRGALPYFLYDQTDAVLAGVDARATWVHNSWLSSELKGSYLWARDIRQHDYFVEIPPANLFYRVTCNLPKPPALRRSELSLTLDYTFRQFFAPRVVPPDSLSQSPSEEPNPLTNDDRIFDFTAAPSGYFLAELLWIGEIKQFTLTLQIRNLLNTSYRSYTDRLRYFADDAGRNFVASVKYKF